MKILLYSITTLIPDHSKSSLCFYPSRAECWSELAKDYPNVQFTVVCDKHNEYFLDFNDGQIHELSDKVSYVYYPVGAEVAEITKMISDIKPDLVVAINVPDIPVDWGYIKASIIAEQLKCLGFRVVCHSPDASIKFADKWRTHCTLKELGFNVAPAVYVQNNLYNLHSKIKEISANAYREYILWSVKQLNYPVLIKNTFYCGSIDMKKANNYIEVAEILSSQRNDADFLVEEYIQGEHFGTEIHGAFGKYNIMPPMLFSTNDEGVVDPFKNIKVGPVLNQQYKISELLNLLKKLAEIFEFEGTAQVDLIFSNGQWYIVEVNPRLSYMTDTISFGMQQRSLYKAYVDSALCATEDYNNSKNLKYAINFKVDNIEKNLLNRVTGYSAVRSAKMTNTYRQGSFIECNDIVLGGYDSKKEAYDNLLNFSKIFPEIVPIYVISNITKMLEII